MNASGDLFPEPADKRRGASDCARGRGMRRFALADGPALLDGLTGIITQAPLRHMTTPGGFRMSVSMTNCGTLGWITDRSGYRYAEVDPESGAAGRCRRCSRASPLGRRRGRGTGALFPMRVWSIATGPARG